jgi:hypothetical protein
VKLKLDENIGRRGVELLRRAGYDVATVADQGLAGASDQALIDVCRKEERGLVTLDVDFANPLRFNPADYAGIAVLRPPRRLTPDDLYEGLQTLSGALARADLTGQLWIIQKGKIRIYQPED